MPSDLIDHVREVRDKAVYDADILINNYPWDQAKDIRIRSLSKVIHLLVGLHISLRSFSEASQQGEDYWDEISLPRPSRGDPQQYLVCFELFVKIGYVASLYSILESSFRVYLEFLEPLLYHENRLKTRKIIRELLFCRLDREYSYGFEWMTILGHIRNSLHNNGVFRPHDDQPQAFTYRGRSFEFVPDRIVDFANWDLLLNLTDDLRGLLFQVARDKHVSAHPGEIIDPSIPQ
jgi:hypothetical protein